MSIFNFTAVPVPGTEGGPITLQYDNLQHKLFLNGMEIINTNPPYHRTIHGRILFGKKCNMNCSYCQQVKEEHPINPNADEFVSKFNLFMSEAPLTSVGFEGGETLMYFDQMVQYHAALKKNWPDIYYTFFTNGILINDTIIDWCIENQVNICLSHDGPGQHVRGIDPLEDVNVVRCLQRYIDSGMRLAFTPTFHRYNYTIDGYLDFMREKLTLSDNSYSIGSMLLMYVVDDVMAANLIPEDKAVEYFQKFYTSVFEHPDMAQLEYLARLSRGFVENLGHPVDYKLNCRTTDPNIVFMDTYGNITRCGFYNHTDVDVDTQEPIGAGSIYGRHVSDYEFPELKKCRMNVRLHCRKCPLMQICMGGCPYAPQKYFEQNCKFHFYYHLVVFAIAIHSITGYILSDVNFSIEKMWEEYHAKTARHTRS